MTDNATPERLPTPGTRSPTRSGGWQAPSVEELQPRLPLYHIQEMLGRGGMGAVYRGSQTHLDRPVAIKILPPLMDDEIEDNQFSARFKNEAKAMARLNHPGIVKVFDFGETADGMLYIVMEFVEGTDVARMLHAQGRLPPDHAFAIAAHVCDALQYAHKQGVLHRDIKPANIMVGYDGVVKVADFGLAKMSKAGESGLTRSGMTMGTLHYMAPEALMLGSSVDHRADIYAMGVMLYQMLTGKLPQGIFRLPSQIVEGLDTRYDGIIRKALSEDRDLRQQSAAEFRADLDVLLTRPILKVEAATNHPPAALSTQARPKHPPGQPQTSAQPRYVKPRKSIADALLWPAILVFCAAGFYVWKIPSGRQSTAAEPATVKPQPVEPVQSESATTRPATAQPQAASTPNSAHIPPASQPPANQPPAASSSPKDPIGRFTFDGLTPEPNARIVNAAQQNGALELNGAYEHGKSGGYRAVFSTPALDYNHFTTAVRLRPGRANDVLLVGGTSYRWLSLKWLSPTSLTLFLNNQRFSHVVSGVDIPLEQWVTLAVSCDLTAREVAVYVNGKNAAKVALPDDFKLDIIGSNAEQSDKVWTPTNYSNGTTFKGLIDELVVYGRVLSDQEVAGLLPGQNTPATEQALAVTAVTPSSPARLKLGERLNVSVSYNNTSADNVHIWARPYTQGKRSPGYSAHPSPAYPKGRGQIEGWFYFQQATTVDEVRVEMVDAQSKQVVGSTSYFVQASWSGDGGSTPAKVAAAPAPVSNITVGQTVPIKFKAVDGREVDLASLQGKVVLIDFWASWCGPCVAEIPNVVAAYQKLHPKGFEIIGISFDSDKDAMERMTRTKGMTWPQFFDGKAWQNAFGTQFGIRSIPTMWLIDRQGKIASTNARSDLAGQVARLLDAPATGNVTPTHPMASNAVPSPAVTLPARRAVVTAQLSSIPFPNSDHTSLKNYVKALLAYSPWSNNQSDKVGVDERQSLLQDVAAQNFSVLLETLTEIDPKMDVTAKNAVVSVARQYANEKNKSAVLQALPRNDALAVIIAEKNWIQDATPALVSAIGDYPYLSRYSGHEIGFFTTCFQSKEAAVWQKLETLFSNPSFTVADSVFTSGMQRMPDAAKTSHKPYLAKLANVLWETAKKASPGSLSAPYRFIRSAEAAAKFGHSEALQALGTFLLSGTPQVKDEHKDTMQKNAVTAVQSITGCPNTLPPTEVGRWVLDQVSSLRWEDRKNQFVVDALKRP